MGFGSIDYFRFLHINRKRAFYQHPNKKSDATKRASVHDSKDISYNRVYEIGIKQNRIHKDHF